MIYFHNLSNLNILYFNQLFRINKKTALKIITIKYIFEFDGLLSIDTNPDVLMYQN